jgi:hypothetical protein
MTGWFGSKSLTLVFLSVEEELVISLGRGSDEVRKG